MVLQLYTYVLVNLEPNVFTASPDKNHDESLSNQNVSMQSANDHGFHSTGTVSYRGILKTSICTYAQ